MGGVAAVRAGGRTGLGGRLLETLEGAGPEQIEIAAQELETGLVELVHAAGALGAVDHEVRILQHLQVLGDRRPAHGQVAGEHADRQRPFGQPLDDEPPGIVPQDLERLQSA